MFDSEHPIWQRMRWSWAFSRPRRLKEGLCLRVERTTSQHQFAVAGDDVKRRVRGLATCGQSWGCPACNYVRSLETMRRNSGRVKAIEALTPGQGWYAGVLTVSHGSRDTLRESLEAVSTLSGSGGRQASSLRDKYGVSAQLWTLEVTCGKHGWHPHNHVFFRAHPRNWWAYWDHLVREHKFSALCHGRYVVDEANYSSKCRRVDDALAYLAKFGLAEWSGTGKAAPYGLLRAASFGCPISAAKWLEFRSVMKRRKACSWSGLGRVALDGSRELGLDWQTSGAVPASDLAVMRHGSVSPRF
jgi:hypothetical protein